MSTKPSRGLGKGTKDAMATTTEGAAPAEAAKGEAAKGGGKMKLVVVALVVVVVLGAVYMFVLKPKDAAAADKPAKPKPTPGAVVKLDPITVNLAGGHFLKLGLSLQASADAGEDVSGAKALDAAIGLFSGKSITELARKDGREKAKADLVSQVSGLYEDKVYDIYFTDFVMQ